MQPTREVQPLPVNPKENANGGSDKIWMYMKLGAIVVGSFLMTVALHKSGMWQPLLSVAMERRFTSVGPQRVIDISKTKG